MGRGKSSEAERYVLTWPKVCQKKSAVESSHRMGDKVHRFTRYFFCQSLLESFSALSDGSRAS